MTGQVCEQCGAKCGKSKDRFGHIVRDEDLRERSILFQARNGNPEPGTIHVCPDCATRGFPWVRAEDSDDAYFYTQGRAGRKVIGVGE
jgi:hypothetical protein